jgi:hypothetical protein
MKRRFCLAVQGYMEPSKRLTVFESTLWPWFFLFWAVGSSIVFLLKLPLQPLNTLRLLSVAFQNTEWSFSQMGGIWLDHLLVLVSSLALLVVVIGTGDRLLNFIRPMPAGRLEAWVWRLALGWLFWGTLALVLALENLFFQMFMTGVLAFALVFVLWKDRYRAIVRCWPFQGDMPLP